MISAAHLHLMVNHFPLLGMFFGTALLIGYFVCRCQQQFLWVALFVIFISGLSGIPTFYSGESTEDIVEAQPHVSKVFLDKHEEAAEITVWALGSAAILSFLSILSLYFKKEAYVKTLSVTTLLFTLIAVGFTAWTANLGGKISHPELRDGSLIGQGEAEGEIENNNHD